MKTARWMMLGAMLGFIASSAVSCGGPASKCGPQNCPFGCCDAAGTCQLGSSEAQCGSQGAACSVCSFSQRCTIGTCSTIGSTGGGTGQGGGGGTTGGGSGGGDGGVTGGGGGTTGGGGGTTGGGGGTTGGGGGMTGGGGGTTGGGGGTTGGGGGSTGGGGGTICSPTNCAGCCGANGQCVLPPNNANNTTCGFGGNSCFDCASVSLVCNSSTLSCASPPVGGGGGATGGGGGSTGGGGGTTGGGGGATGGGGGSTMLAGGDTCAAAVALPSPGTIYSGTTVGRTNDYVFSDQNFCSGGSSTSTTGPDVVYRIVVPVNQTLDVEVVPESTFDATLNLIANAADCSNAPTCLAGADDPETITWTNTTGTTATVLVLIDAYSSGGSGAYTISYTLTP